MCVHNFSHGLLFYALLARSTLLFYHCTTDQLFSLLPEQKPEYKEAIKSFQIGRMQVPHNWRFILKNTFQSRESPTGVFPYAIEKLSILAFLLSEAKASWNHWKGEKVIEFESWGQRPGYIFPDFLFFFFDKSIALNNRIYPLSQSSSCVGNIPTITIQIQNLWNHTNSMLLKRFTHIGVNMIA